MKFYVFFEFSFNTSGLESYYECDTKNEVNLKIKEVQDIIAQNKIIDVQIKDILVFEGSEIPFDPNKFIKSKKSVQIKFTGI